MHISSPYLIMMDGSAYIIIISFYNNLMQYFQSTYIVIF